MMVRDEAVNLRVNLPLWTLVADAFVILVDERTVDDSKSVATSILSKSKKSYVLADYKFSGFGQARTLSLSKTWEHFPNATHVLIADPDWKPDVSTIDLNDLDNSADVFRFTVFDRNGITRRRIDWLLRHRSGLKMRYSLHEVLDIGMYQVKQLNWVVHEIEQLGTWHATVGHGHSHALARYEFDLQLLHKDLLHYGHDPHVHYYLGITYFAFSEGLANEKGQTNSTSVDLAIFYLTKRISSIYDDEFVEERWACMYTLGAIYASPLKLNVPFAIKWLSLCRDYNPKQGECSSQLVKLYLHINRFDLATDELTKLLKQRFEDRVMLNMLHTTTCVIPSLVVEINSIKMKAGMMTYNEALYTQLMINTISANACPALTGSLHSTEESIMKFLQTRKRDELTNDHICARRDFHLFLIQNEFWLHPCQAFRERFLLETVCSAFAVNIPPPSEELQMHSNPKSFVGMALIPDIIHHAYSGNRDKVFRRDISNPFRILFAQYFDKRVVYQLLGFFHRHGFNNFQIVVLSESPQLLEEMKQEISLCLQLVPFDTDSIFFEERSLDSFLSYNREAQRFDYIEYNCGVSMDPNYINHLRGFRQLLSEDGIIGLSFFAKNVHTDNLRQQLTSLNFSQLVPFSLERRRVVLQYLETHHLGFMKEDKTLMIQLGAESVESVGPPKNPSEIVPLLDWISFDRKEITKLLTDLSFAILSWVPTAYSHPYEEIPHYLIFKYFTLGITEDSFLYHYFTNFRYSLYISKSSANKGRVSLKSLLNLTQEISIHDRIGSLTQIFSSLEDKSRLGQAGIFSFSPFYQNSFFHFDYVIPPKIIPALTLLSTEPSFQDMVKFISNPPVGAEMSELIEFLQLLESINSITFSHSYSGPHLQTTDRAEVKLSDKKVDDVQAQHMESLGFDEEFVNSFLSQDSTQRIENESPPAISRDQFGFDDDFLSSSAAPNREEIITQKQSTAVEETKSNLQELLKLLKKKTSSFGSNIADRSVNSDERELDLKNFSHAASSILLPNKIENSLSSYRGAACWRNSSQKCSEPKPVKRKTAALNMASWRKFVFDTRQLFYLQSLNILNEALVRDILELPELTSSQQSLYKLFKLQPNALLNRALHIDSDLNIVGSFLYWEVISQLKQAAKQANDVDYFVVDVVVQDPHLEQITSQLMRSTIWFDLTNGAALCSHYDDGLSFHSFKSLSQQLAYAVTGSQAAKVVKYFTLTMNLTSSAQSPVILGNRDELVLILWLGPQIQNNDGLLIYDSRTADCLFSQGISKYPSVHPDFLSKGGDLHIDVAKKCGSHQYEFVERKRNRLVVVKSRSPVVFSVNASVSRSIMPDTLFVDEIFVALVVVVNFKNTN